jgi:hypothetical protein
MKSIILVTTYLASFVLFFFIISSVGLLWSSPIDVYTNKNWFMVYSMFLGWWLAIFPAREYYMLHQRHFDKIF